MADQEIRILAHIIPETDDAALKREQAKIEKAFSGVKNSTGAATPVAASARLVRQRFQRSDVTSGARFAIQKSLGAKADWWKDMPMPKTQKGLEQRAAMLELTAKEAEMIKRGGRNDSEKEYIYLLKQKREEYQKTLSVLQALRKSENSQSQKRKTETKKTKEQAKRSAIQLEKAQKLTDIAVDRAVKRSQAITEESLRRDKLRYEQNQQMKAETAAKKAAANAPVLTPMQKAMANVKSSISSAAVGGVTKVVGAENYEKISQALAKVKEQFKGVNEEGNKAGKTLPRAMSKIGGAVGKVTRIFQRFGQVLVWRLYRMAAMKTLQQIGQGFKNLTAYSKTFGTQFYENVQKLKTSATFVGNAFAAMVAPIINFVTPALEKLMDTVANLANKIGQFIASALGQKQFSAALKHAVDETKKAGGKLKDILGFDEINRLSGDTGEGDEASKMFTEWGTIEGATSNMADAIETIKQAWETMKEAIAPIFDAIGRLVQTLLPVVVQLIAQIMEALAPIVALIADLVVSIIDELGPFIEAFMPIVTGLIETISPFIQRIVTVIANLVKEILPGLTSTMSIIASVLDLVFAVASPVLDIITTIVEVIGDVLGPIIGVVAAAIDLVAVALAPIVDTVKAFIGYLTSTFSPALQIVREIISGLAHAIGSVLVTAIGIVKGVIAGLTPIVKGLGSIFTTIGTAITNAWGKVQKAVEHVVDRIKEAWDSIKKLTAKGGELFEGMKEGIANIFTTLVNSIIKGINWVIRQPLDLLNGILTKIREATILGYQPFKNLGKITVPQIPLLASGGMVPNKGQLFVANEAGPEVVANMGGSTGVMNMNQMESAVANGNTVIVNAMYDALSQLINTINNKDTNFYLDGRKVGQTVSKYQNDYRKSYGV